VKPNKITRLLRLMIVIMIAVTIGPTSSAQQESHYGAASYKEYPIVEFNEPQPENSAEREERRKKSVRYDNKKWTGIMWEPGNKDSLWASDPEMPFEPVFPLTENDAVIIGKIVSGKASLNNKRNGVYSEYLVSVLEVLKNTGPNKISPTKPITIDRPGGAIIYSNGVKAAYTFSGKSHPRVGSDYLLFLKDDHQSPNYEIVTGYEFYDGKVYGLDNKATLLDNYLLRDIPTFKNEMRKLIQADSQSKKPAEKS
jgi:hypothetical protein